MPAREVPVPVGLLGLAIRMARWKADGVEQLFEREGELLRAIRDLADVCASHFGVETVHGVGRREEDYVVAIVNVSVDQDLDGFVGAVGEEEVLGLYAEEWAKLALDFAVFGIDGEQMGSGARADTR